MAILYKYLPPTRIDVLEKQVMRLSQPCTLNDPHDALPAIRSRLEEKYGDDAVIADDFSVERIYSRSIREDYSRQLGVLCFSANPHVHLMWSHYCLNHTGYLLHVKKDHDFFTRKKFNWTSLYDVQYQYDGLPYPSKITYTDKRKIYYLEDGIPFDVLFQKSHHWAYEEEYRSLMNLIDAKIDDETKNNPWPVYLLELPKGLIVGATLGLDANDDTIQRVKTACKALSVPAFRVIADHLTYELHSVRCENC